MTEAALKEVERALRQIAKNPKPEKWLAKNYIGAGVSELEFLDTKIPLVRRRFAEGFSFSKKSADEQWQIWNYIWKHSHTFETMLMASYWANMQSTEELVKKSKIIFAWLNRVDNWAHSDEMSSHCAKILETDHERFLPVYEQWSKSKNPWLRRQSLVGILYYSRMRKKTPSFAILKAFIDRQLHDEHFYVQKAVGWTLRECWNLYPQKTEAYLESIAHAIPAAGWTAATEKLSKSTKSKLTAIRKMKKPASSKKFSTKK